MAFEEWLSEIIKNKRINLSEMLREIGFSYQPIYDSLFNKERNRELRSSELIAICRYVGINPMEFADEKPETRR